MSSSDKRARQASPAQQVKASTLVVLFVATGSRLPLQATVINDSPKSPPLPGVGFLREGSVVMLMILKSTDSTDEKWAAWALYGYKGNSEETRYVRHQFCVVIKN
ncbi:hypothetical protein LQW54_012136 [Pestalotiopsis sp. IQ-011]